MNLVRAKSQAQSGRFQGSLKHPPANSFAPPSLFLQCRLVVLDPMAFWLRSQGQEKIPKA